MIYDENKVKLLIARHFGVSIDKITDSSSFMDDLGGDSLDTVELILEFEDAFGIEVSEKSAESMNTVQDLLDYLKSISK